MLLLRSGAEPVAAAGPLLRPAPRCTPCRFWLGDLHTVLLGLQKKGQSTLNRVTRLHRKFSVEARHRREHRDEQCWEEAGNAVRGRLRLLRLKPGPKMPSRGQAWAGRRVVSGALGGSYGREQLWA